MNVPALLIGAGTAALVLMAWPRKAKGSAAPPRPGATGTSPRASLDTLTADTRAVADAFLAKLRAEGISHVVVSTLRTCSQQNSLHAAGKTPVRGCRSWHTWGRAIDVMPLDGNGKLITNGSDPLYTRMAELARTVGFKAGLDFKDPVHFEYHPGLKIEDVCPDPDACLEPISLVPPDELLLWE